MSLIRNITRTVLTAPAEVVRGTVDAFADMFESDEERREKARRRERDEQ